MKKLLLSIVLLVNISAFAGDVVKYVFLSSDARNPANSAIFNGARDALKEMSSRYGKDLKIEFISASSSIEKQISQLSTAYLESFKGALIVPVDANAIAPKVSSLAKNGFYCASVGAEIEGGVFTCSTDYSAALKLVNAEIAKLAGGKNLTYRCYFKTAKNGDSSEPVESALKEAFSNQFNGKEMKAIYDELKPKVSAAMDFYSVYAKQNADDILRTDNFAEIFFSPALLSNMLPIKDDTDRYFTICLGALPQLEYYLATSQINLCVYDDWYGWGYYSMRVLVEKSLESINPTSKSKLLAPLSATPRTVKSFSKDWAKWIF